MKFLRHIICFLLISLATNLIYSQTLPESLNNYLQSLTNEEKVKELGDFGWSQRENDRDLAKMAIDSALALSYKYDFKKEIAKLSNYAGALFLHYYFNHRDAIPILNIALEYGFITNDSTQIAYAYNNLGDAYYLNDNGLMALEYGELSLDIFQKLNDERGVAYSLVNIGLAYRIQQGELSTAIEFFNQAFTLAEESGDNGRMANCIHEIAITMHKMDSIEKSIELYHRAYDLYIMRDNFGYAAMTQTGIGNAHYDLGNYELASDHFTKALEMNSRRSNDFNQISILLGIALVHSQNRIVDEGIAFLNEAFSIAKNLNVSSKLMECHRKTHEFYYNLGMHQEASEASIKFMNLAEESFKSQQVEVLNQLKLRFEKQQEILEAQNNLKTKKKNQTFLVLFILLLVILVLLLVSIQYRIRKKNQELHLMNQSKDKLFSIISHDLKNPFVALHQYIDLLKDGEMTDSMKEWFINDLDQKATATQNLLENLLNLSASRTGKLSFNPTEIGSIDLVQDLLKQAKAQLDQKHITVELDIDGKTIFADNNMLNLSLRNLLSNAIKFSPENGKVAISSNTSEQGTTIKIKDFGIGMDKKTLDGLFQSDFTNSKEGTAGEKGTGIGLSLCKEFVDKHDGSITAASEKNNGSIFTIFLPSV